jgi:hypothetical protein
MVGNWLKGLGLAGATPDMLFAYLRSTGLTGSLSDMLSAYVFSSVQGKVLIDLSPTSSGHYTLGTDSVLTTAYKLGISTVLPTASTTYALYGRASSATDYLKILSSGYLSLDVDGTIVTSAVLATKDSEYREYSVTLDGNDFVFKENDTVISTVTNATAAAKTLTLNLIGNSNGANFYLGVLADAVMGAITFPLSNLTANTEVSGGVTATYQNIPESARDTYTLIDGAYISSEKVANGNFATDSDWLAFDSTNSISNNQLTVVTVISARGAYQVINTVVGETYLVEGSSINQDADLILRISDGSFPSSAIDGAVMVNNTASFEFTAFSSLSTVYLRNTSAGTNIWTRLSVKRKIEVA